MNTLKLLLFGWFFLIALLGNSQTLEGKVVGIMDGDTFKLLTRDSTLVKVRLANIDCPANKQPYSAKAIDFTFNAIFEKTVSISILKTDCYKRYISNVTYNDSLSLCHELVKNGLAWPLCKIFKRQRVTTNGRQSKKRQSRTLARPKPHCTLGMANR